MDCIEIERVDQGAAGDAVAGSSSTTAALDVGQMARGFVNSGSDQDWYAIDLVAGQTVTIDLKGVSGSDLDAYLRVFGTDGLQLMANDDADGTSDSRLVLTASASGTYFVSAGGAEGSTGRYELTVTGSGGGGMPPLQDIEVEAGPAGEAANSGNVFVDALSAGTRWAGNTLNYFLDSGGSAGAWNAIEQASIRAAFDSWSAVANINFVEVNSAANAQFIEQLNSNPGSPGSLGSHQKYFSNGNGVSTIGLNNQANGQYNVDGFGWDRGDPNGGLAIGGQGYLTIVHEIGHGLGFDHTHSSASGSYTDSGGTFPGVTGNPQTDSGDNALNQDVFSVMSYVNGVTTKQLQGGASQDNYGFVAGPGAFDIATAQFLYGANTTQNGGDDVYTIPSTNGVGTYYTTIWDTGGNDTIQYGGADGVIIDLRPATLQNEDGGGGYRSGVIGGAIKGGFYIAGDFTNAIADQGAETGVIIENGTGSVGADTIIGNNADNVLSGNGGLDSLYGFAGADILRGGAGNDFLFVDAADTEVNGGADFDTVYVQQAAGMSIDLTAGNYISIEQIWGNVGNDTFQGSNDGDRLIGNGGNDVLVGRGGQDILYGLSGADQLYGGDGNDFLFVDSDDTLVNGGADYDTIIVQQSGAIMIDLLTAQYNDIEQIVGNVGNDVLSGTAGAERLIGGAGNDILQGRGGSDTLYGLQGADQIFAGEGDDFLFFDSDDTMIRGGGGYDQGYVQGPGAVTVDMIAWELEFVQGNDGNDFFGGGAGEQAAFGNAGNDTFSLAGGNDRIDGGAGSDTINYSDVRANYAINNLGGGLYTVSHLGGAGADGIDTVTTVEFLQFADQLFAL